MFTSIYEKILTVCLSLACLGVAGLSTYAIVDGITKTDIPEINVKEANVAVPINITIVVVPAGTSSSSYDFDGGEFGGEI